MLIGEESYRPDLTRFQRAFCADFAPGVPGVNLARNRVELCLSHRHTPFGLNGRRTEIRVAGTAGRKRKLWFRARETSFGHSLPPALVPQKKIICRFGLRASPQKQTSCAMGIAGIAPTRFLTRGANLRASTLQERTRVLCEEEPRVHETVGRFSKSRNRRDNF
jgi:hypothetical protein